MNQIEGADSRDDAADVLRHVLNKRVRLWSENGELHYRAPRGTLSVEEVAKLRSLSNRIVALLDESAARRRLAPKLEPRGRFERVPLAFSQLKYWQAEQLQRRPSLRSVAAAMRLCGPLDVGLLQECVAAVVQRHEALRTRVAIVDGSPTQQIDERAQCDLLAVDFSRLPEHERSGALTSSIHELIVQPVDVRADPLFGVLLAALSADEHVLVVALEHIISDGFSVNVLLRDLLVTYQCRSERRATALAPVPIQLGDYAVWQHRALDSWLRQHGAYWTSRLAGCGRVRFPERGVLSPTSVKCAAIPVCLDADVRAALRDWSRVRGTTMVMTVFTAFVALVMRCCEVSDVVVRFQTDGRFNPLLESAVGYFASVLNLRLELHPEETFVDLLGRVTRAYCAACEHADMSWLDTRMAQPEFVHNCAFNWVPQALGHITHSPGLKGPLTLHPYEFALPALEPDGYEWDHEPSILLFDEGDVVRGRVLYAPGAVSTSTIETFRDHLLLLIRALLRDPQQRVSSVVLR